MNALKFGVQLNDLRELQDGWLDGEGIKPPTDGLQWLRHNFECNYPDGLPLPHLYPTENGGIQAEWSLGPNEVTLDVDLETHLGEWHLLNVESDEVVERTLNFDDDADWRWLVERINALAACYGDLKNRSCRGHADPD